MKFKSYVMAEPFKPSEEQQRACKALWEYAKLAGEPDHLLFRRLAKEHETTAFEMNRHWKCVESRYKCYDC